MATVAVLFVSLNVHAQLLEKKTLSIETANKIIAGAVAEAKTASTHRRPTKVFEIRAAGFSQ